MIETMQANVDQSSSGAIVRLNVIGTAAFVVSSVVAAAVFNNPTRIVGVVVALVLFAIGIFAFLWSY